MVGVFRRQHGMDIVGQGGKIILFTLPSLAVALWLHRYHPDIAALPASIRFWRPVGYVLLPMGLALWATAVVQLLVGFSGGRLVTAGAYGIVRNPIYSSMTFFVLPAVTLLTGTWVYLIVSAFLYVGVTVFIRREEDQLGRAFGIEYTDYTARVDRLIPFRRP